MIADLSLEFRRHKRLAESAMTALDDVAFFQKPAPAVHSVAVIVKHLAGNFRSRWTDFLTSDGDKPDRDRESEFLIFPEDTRAALLDRWHASWSTLETLLSELTDTDLLRVVTIRSEAHTVRQALLRGLTHTAWHVGQIAYVARLLAPEAPWWTIPPGGSKNHEAGYLRADAVAPNP